MILNVSTFILTYIGNFVGLIKDLFATIANNDYHVANNDYHVQGIG